VDAHEAQRTEADHARARNLLMPQNILLAALSFVCPLRNNIRPRAAARTAQGPGSHRGFKDGAGTLGDRG
jgi:hypothetical protein